MKENNPKKTFKNSKSLKGQISSKHKQLTYFVLTFILLILSVNLFAQKDVTQFLGIPIDGFKDEMIKKLKDKGFKSSIDNKDVLIGEFNGKDVNIHIVTNNNKVYRIMVADANLSNESDIKIRFNNLCQQFYNNNKYLPTSDSTLSKYIISEREDVSYELLVNKKRYEAAFYQKTTAYDSLFNEMSDLLKKEQINDTAQVRLRAIMEKMIDNINFKKVVWFMINERYGKYFIAMYYDNVYNKANGEDL